MATEATALSPAMAVLQTVSGFWPARAVYVAAKLGLADLVQDAPKTAAELANVYADPRAVAISAATGTGQHRLVPGRLRGSVRADTV